MDKREQFDRLNKLLANVREDYSLESIHDALIVWYAQYALGLDPDECSERIVEDRRAEGVDAVLVDNKNFILYFVQACFVGKFENTKSNYGENDVKNTLMGLKFLLSGDYKGKITPELENLIDEYHEYDKTGDYTTKVLFLTAKNEPVDDKFIIAFNEEFKDVEVQFIGFDNILEFYQNDYLILRSPAPDKISFELLSAPLEKSRPFRSVVFTIKAKELAKTYSEHREKLFQQNVRNPMGLGKRINDLIFNTATSDVDSSNFWYFNNGIHIVCKNANVTTGKKVIVLTSPQIINGAQTTHAVYEAYKNGQLKEDVEILVKAIESDDKKFVDHVTLFSNSQNAIRLRDLSSNDEVQDKVQRILRDTYRFFYQRKRGEFETNYPTDEIKKKEFGQKYRDKIIDNEKASLIYLATYLGKPVEAKTDKWKVFLKDGGYYYDIFDSDSENLAERILFCWKLMKFIEKKKREFRGEYNVEKKKENPDASVLDRYFITQADFFIGRLMRYYLEKEGHRLDVTADILKLNDLIDSDDLVIVDAYDKSVDQVSKQIQREKRKPSYYMNKFFKEAKHIVLILERIEIEATGKSNNYNFGLFEKK
jgi:hypothetical protein